MLLNESNEHSGKFDEIMGKSVRWTGCVCANKSRHAFQGVDSGTLFF